MSCRQTRVRRLLGAAAALVLLGACGAAPREAEVASIPPPPSALPLSSPRPSITDAFDLDYRERAAWNVEMNELLAPCPEAVVTLAACLDGASSCTLCEPAAKYLARQIKAGAPRAEREKKYRARFAGEVHDVPTTGGIELGSRDAPVTLVVWEDPECPFCKMFSPVAVEMQRRLGADLRLVVKWYPLTRSHLHAMNATRALVAAERQGKFWAMQSAVFDNQDKLEDGDLDRYAKSVGLDLRRFKQDSASRETAARIEAEMREADRLDLDGVPFVFANGRRLELAELDHDDFIDDLTDRLRVEVIRARSSPTRSARK